MLPPTNTWHGMVREYSWFQISDFQWSKTSFLISDQICIKVSISKARNLFPILNAIKTFAEFQDGFFLSVRWLFWSMTQRIVCTVYSNHEITRNFFIDLTILIIKSSEYTSQMLNFFIKSHVSILETDCVQVTGRLECSLHHTAPHSSSGKAKDRIQGSF